MVTARNGLAGFLFFSDFQSHGFNRRLHGAGCGRRSCVDKSSNLYGSGGMSGGARIRSLTEQ